MTTVQSREEILGGRMDLAFDELPPDMQCLIEQLVLDYEPDAVIPDRLPLGTVPVSGLPLIPLDESDRGTAYALAMDTSRTPPVLIAEGCFLDGKHRAFSARARSQDFLAALDLSGIVPAAALRGNSMGPVAGFEPSPCTGPRLRT